MRRRMRLRDMGGDGISGGASPYTLDLDLYNILYLDLNILYILDIDI